VYAFSGLLAGVFRSIGKIGVALGFVTASMILSVFMMGYDQTVMSMWETAVAAALFLMVPADIKERVPVESLGALGEKKNNSAGNAQLKELTAERMNNLARVFEEISMTFADAEPKSDDSEKNYLSNIFQTITGFFCQKCAIYKTCWESEFYQTYREFFNIISLAEMKGSLDYDDINADFRRRCIRPKELTTAINGVLESARTSEYWGNKLEQSRDLLSHQLKEVSSVIKNLAQEINFNSAVDSELKAKLERECREMGVPVREIVPIVTDNEYVFIKVVADACIDRETCDTLIGPSISTVMGTRYEVSHRKCPRSGRGTCEFTLARAFGFRVVTGVAQLSKTEVSGDSFNVATLKDGRELIVLSDGMGVGHRAAQESKATVNLLEEMFNTGFGQEIALKTINSVLLLRNQGESFATVDLALINLYSGDVDFIKIGGVPTFLKREKRVGIITAESLPIGIVDELDIATERRSLLPGDMLIMVSDGVLEPAKMVKEREQWLRKYLSGVQESDPHRLAEMIVNRALEMARGEPRDDMTVVCARLESSGR
jgi:stage II sporulation protein E